MKCTQCGAEIDEHTTVCPYCDSPCKTDPEPPKKSFLSEHLKRSTGSLCRMHGNLKAVPCLTGIASIILAGIIYTALAGSTQGFAGNIVQTAYMGTLLLAGILSLGGFFKRILAILACIFHTLALMTVIMNTLLNSTSTAIVLIQIILLGLSSLYAVKSGSRLYRQ